MSIENGFEQGPPWHAGTLVGFDLETTGVDTTTDRVVTAAVVHVAPDGEVVRAREWLVDAGVRIPEAASAVHGVTTGRVRAYGTPSAQAIPDIVAELERAWCAGLPVVIFNAPYDLTLLDAEAVRAGVPRLAARPWWPSARVVDPLVIDRGIDRYRSGKRTLGATAEHYRVDARDAHSALGDAVAAAGLARAIATGHELLRSVDALTLHRAQVDWHHEWAAQFQDHLRSRGKTDVVIDPVWPLRTPVVGRHRASQVDARPVASGRHRRPEPPAGEQARVTRAA